MSNYRYKTAPPSLRGEIALSDARKAAESFPHLLGRITDVITSPPYLDTTSYREDQWLRLWFLGRIAATFTRDDGRHHSVNKYKEFLSESWSGVAPLLADEVRIVVIIGGRKLSKEEALELLESSLKRTIQRNVHIQDRGVSSLVKRTQASAFRGSRPSPTVEYDFCFLLR